MAIFAEYVKAPEYRMVYAVRLAICGTVVSTTGRGQLLFVFIACQVMVPREVGNYSVMLGGMMVVELVAPSIHSPRSGWLPRRSIVSRLPGSVVLQDFRSVTSPCRPGRVDAATAAAGAVKAMAGADQAAADGAVLRGTSEAEWVMRAPRAAGPWLCRQSHGMYMLKNASVSRLTQKT